MVFDHGVVERIPLLCEISPLMQLKDGDINCLLQPFFKVFYYGDKNEDAVTNGTDTVRFTELLDTRAAYRFMEELGTEPSVYYLPAVDRAFYYKEGFEGLSEEEVALYKKEARITE